jgi:thiol-disulfide isomerase/thioredoxin
MEGVTIIRAILGILLLVCIGYYVYSRYFKTDKQFVPNNEYIPEPKNFECILFYTSWCPHCKKTIKDWDEYRRNNQNDYAIFSEVDCDKQMDKAEMYEIDSYPTIIMMYKEKKYIFDSNFTKEAMDKFVSTILRI